MTAISWDAAMPDAKPDIKRSLDPLWTLVGSTLFGACVLIGLFIRSGELSIFPSSPSSGMQGDISVSVAYWGLLASSAGLALLGTIARRYVAKGYRDDGFAWPRFTLAEHEARDALPAKGSIAVLTLVPVVLWIMSAVVYSRSRIALWNSHDALADGFVSSRWAALQDACTKSPCFRIHPLDKEPPLAVQWFAYVHEPLVLGLVIYALYAWIKWATDPQGPRRK